MKFLKQAIRAFLRITNITVWLSIDQMAELKAQSQQFDAKELQNLRYDIEPQAENTVKSTYFKAVLSKVIP